MHTNPISGNNPGLPDGEMTPIAALDLLQEARNLADLIELAASQPSIACAAALLIERLDAAAHSLKGLLIEVAA